MISVDCLAQDEGEDFPDQREPVPLHRPTLILTPVLWCSFVVVLLGREPPPLEDVGVLADATETQSHLLDVVVDVVHRLVGQVPRVRLQKDVDVLEDTPEETRDCPLENHGVHLQLGS